MPFDWFAWWNAIYTLPLAVVLAFLAVTALLGRVGGAIGELTGGHDAHVEHDAGVDVDADTDVDLDHDLDVDHDVDLDHDLDLDHDGHVSAVEHATAVAHGHALVHHEPPFFISALMFIGVGRAPVVMVLQVLLLFWGLIGLALHQNLSVTGPFALVWSLPVTLVLSVLATRTFAQVFGRYLKQKELFASRHDELVGCTGQVVYQVTGEEGTINVRDHHGTLHRVRARSRHGELEAGWQVIILGLDPETKVYQVDDAATFVDRP